MEMNKLSDLINQCQIQVKLTNLLGILARRTEHVLTCSELLGFTCAYVTGDCAIDPDNEEHSSGFYFFLEIFKSFKRIISLNTLKVHFKTD